MHANFFAAHAPVEGARTAFKRHLCAVVEHQAEGNVALQVGLEVEAWRCVAFGGHGAEAPKVGVFVGVTDAHEAAGHQVSDADDLLGLDHATGRDHAGTSEHVGLLSRSSATHEPGFSGHQIGRRLVGSTEHAAPQETTADDGGHGEQSPVPRGQPRHKEDGHGADANQHEGDVPLTKRIRHVSNLHTFPYQPFRTRQRIHGLAAPIRHASRGRGRTRWRR